MLAFHESQGVVEVKEGRFPYLCSLQNPKSGKHICSGTLIHPLWVLSTAHCFDKTLQVSLGLYPKIRCGVFRLDTINSGYTFTVIKKTIYEGWNGDLEKGGDIVMLKIDREAPFTLPIWNNKTFTLGTGIDLTALGWGKKGLPKKTPLHLQMTDALDSVPFSVCEKIWAPSRLPHGVLCAGLSAIDICEDDEGGPLILADRELCDIDTGSAFLDGIYGVTSYGSKTCGSRDLPGIFTDFSTYSEWIWNVTEELPTKKIIFKSGEDTPKESKGCLIELPQNPANLPKAILDAGLDPNEKYNSASFKDAELNNPLLHWAARFDAEKCAKLLLEYGSEIEAVNQWFETAMFSVARYGAPKVAQVLVDNDAFVSARDMWGESPLIEASWNGEDEVVTILLTNGAEVSPTDTWLDTPLHEAAWQGHLEITKQLLEYEAEIDAVDATGETPLFNACINGHLKVVEVLVAAGADKTIANNKDELPFTVACMFLSCSPTTKSEIQRLVTP